MHRYLERMSYEIERRFICRIADGTLPEGGGRRIVQGYISEAAAPTVRVRRYGEDLFLTIKTGSGLVRREVEVPIDATAAEHLFEMAGNRLITKLRWEIGRWEIDRFEGKLEGLIVAEAELDSAEETLPPVPPGVELLREVTAERGMTNGSLARLDEAEARALVERLKRG